MFARRITARDVTLPWSRPSADSTLLLILIFTGQAARAARALSCHLLQMPKVRNLTTATPKVRDMFIINIQVILLVL